MADPTGGIGKGGGLGPIKGPDQKTGLDKLGAPKNADADKFQTAMTGGTPGENVQTKSTTMGEQTIQGLQVQNPSNAPSGPFSMQFNRVTEAPTSVSKKEGGASSLKESLVSGTKGILDAGKTQKAEIEKAMADAGKNGVNQAQMLKLQFEVGNFSIFSDIVSRGVNKVTQAVQTAIKNQ